MEAFFLPPGTPGAGRFCLYRDAGPAPRGAIVHVHAFGEEMNLSRRMVALQAGALARAGYAVLHIDLFGCGDSAGDFGAADWQTWTADVLAAADWLHGRVGRPVELWGVRAGCLLAAAVAQAMVVPPRRLIFWQPVLGGDDYWRQLMRLRQMGELVGGKAAAIDLGAAVEVAGYMISPQLAAGIQAARLVLPVSGCSVVCVEIAPAGAGLSLPLANAIADWRASGGRVQACSVAGEAFWQLPEAPDQPALVAATLDLLRQSEHGG